MGLTPEEKKEINYSKQEGEVFLPVSGWENFYSISNLGRVYSNTRTISNYRGSHTRSGFFLKKTLDDKGYEMIVLYGAGKPKRIKVHRIVATHFLTTPNPLTRSDQVNHINGIKNDNRAVNLEWTDNSGNQKHAFRIGLQETKWGKDNPTSKTIIQSDLNGNFIKEWGAGAEIERELGFNRSMISLCCNGRFKNKGYGYKWEFKTDTGGGAEDFKGKPHLRSLHSV